MKSKVKIPKKLYSTDQEEMKLLKRLAASNPDLSGEFISVILKGLADVKNDCVEEYKGEL